MNFLSLQIKNKSLATLVSLGVLFVGSLMVVLPFAHTLNIASFWTAVGVIIGCAVFVMLVVLAMVAISFMYINTVTPLDLREYFLGSFVLVGLLGAIWGSVVYIMGFVPNLAMFVGVVLLLVNCLLLLWYNYVAFLKGKENAQAGFKRYRFVVFASVVVCLVVWLIA